MRIGLVSCSHGKILQWGVEVPARDLYRSPLFQKASAYCTDRYDRWLILSALYGVLKPSDPVFNYDQSLAGMKPAERAEWGMRAREELRRYASHCRGDVTFFVHAGGRYAQLVQGAGLRLEFPVAGLGIGQQLAWYKERGY